MYEVSITDTTDLGAIIREFADDLEDFTPVLNSIKESIETGNTRDRMAGLDKNGKALKDITPETRRRRGGSGPVLAPHESSSRVITSFEAVVDAHNNSVIAGWNSDIPYQQISQGRDITDISPETEKSIDDDVISFIEKVVNK